MKVTLRITTKKGTVRILRVKKNSKRLDRLLGKLKAGVGLTLSEDMELSQMFHSECRTCSRSIVYDQGCYKTGKAPCLYYSKMNYQEDKTMSYEMKI